MDVYLNPLIHGPDGDRPTRRVDTGEITREWARKVYREQRRLLRELRATGGRLKAGGRADGTAGGEA